LYVAQELCQQYLHSFGRTITYTTSDPELSDANVSRTSHLSVPAMLQLGVAGKKNDATLGWTVSNINAI